MDNLTKVYLRMVSFDTKNNNEIESKNENFIRKFININLLWLSFSIKAY